MLFAEGLGSSYLQMADAPQKEEKNLSSTIPRESSTYCYGGTGHVVPRMRSEQVWRDERGSAADDTGWKEYLACLVPS